MFRWEKEPQMDLSYTAGEQAFRDEVRDWLAKRLSKRLSTKVRKAQRLTKADYDEWHTLLGERGWMRDARVRWQGKEKEI